MSESSESLEIRLEQRFGDALEACAIGADGLVTAHVAHEHLPEVALAVRDDPDFSFEQLTDLCAVDYMEYGNGAWQGPRFAVVHHLLSVHRNERLRLKIFLKDDPPRIASVVNVWASANWFEREAYELYGILFDGHPDLRRLLTDYGFIGHPFRKDFPLIGNVEMRYDPEKQRVVYEPVSIQPRVLVPRVIREDNRYADRTLEKGSKDA